MTVAGDQCLRILDKYLLPLENEKKTFFKKANIQEHILSALGFPFALLSYKLVRGTLL